MKKVVKDKKNKRIIWSNECFDEWLEDMKAEGVDDVDINTYQEDCAIFMADERHNLDEDIDGCIVAFGVVGRWNGTFNGGKVFGSNIKNILYTECDYATWYCDRYNVLFDGAHHDGRNHYIYRVAKDRETAERLVDDIAYNGLTEEGFRKKTKSLRKYVAEIYGW